MSLSSVARICRVEGLSRLTSLEPAGPTIRYERDNPGELLHIDTKRLGRFDRVGHRITRKRSFGSKKQGFEFAYVAIDDASRLSYVEVLADERSEAACAFLSNAVSWFARQNVHVERVMTDNGSAFVSTQFREHCEALGARQAHTPRTNGKAERFIQTLLREWAYRFAYESSAERTRWLGTKYLEIPFMASKRPFLMSQTPFQHVWTPFHCPPDETHGVCRPFHGPPDAARAWFSAMQASPETIRACFDTIQDRPDAYRAPFPAIPPSPDCHPRLSAEASNG